MINKDIDIIWNIPRTTKVNSQKNKIYRFINACCIRKYYLI